MPAPKNGPVRCPGCHGRGKVGSSRDALRSIIGSLHEKDVGDPKLFEEAKHLYLALSRRPVASVPDNGKADPKTEHGLAGTKHLGAWKWEATCSCGQRAERGTKTAAIHEIERHIASLSAPSRRRTPAGDITR